MARREYDFRMVGHRAAAIARRDSPATLSAVDPADEPLPRSFRPVDPRPVSEPRLPTQDRTDSAAVGMAQARVEMVGDEAPLRPPAVGADPSQSPGPLPGNHQRSVPERGTQTPLLRATTRPSQASRASMPRAARPVGDGDHGAMQMPRAMPPPAHSPVHASAAVSPVPYAPLAYLPMAVEAIKCPRLEDLSLEAAIQFFEDWDEFLAAHPALRGRPEYLIRSHLGKAVRPSLLRLANVSSTNELPEDDDGMRALIAEQVAPLRDGERLETLERMQLHVRPSGKEPLSAQLARHYAAFKATQEFLGLTTRAAAEAVRNAFVNSIRDAPALARMYKNEARVRGKDAVATVDDAYTLLRELAVHYLYNNAAAACSSDNTLDKSKGRFEGRKDRQDSSNERRSENIPRSSNNNSNNIKTEPGANPAPHAATKAADFGKKFARLSPEEEATYKANHWCMRCRAHDHDTRACPQRRQYRDYGRADKPAHVRQVREESAAAAANDNTATTAADIDDDHVDIIAGDRDSPRTPQQYGTHFRVARDALAGRLFPATARSPLLNRLRPDIGEEQQHAQAWVCDELRFTVAARSRAQTTVCDTPHSTVTAQTLTHVSHVAAVDAHMPDSSTSSVQPPLAKTTETALPCVLSASAQESIRVRTRDEINNIVVTALLDTGATLSCVPAAVVEAHELKTIRAATPKTVRLADQSRLDLTEQVEMRLAFTADAPARTLRLWVMPSSTRARTKAAGSDVIIGYPDLAGYSLTFSSPPTLAFIGTPPEDEPADVPDRAPNDDPADNRPTLPKLGDKVVAPEMHSAVLDALQEYADVFAPIDEQPAALDDFTVELLPGTKPIRLPPRRLNEAKDAFVRSEVQRLLDLHVIEPSTSPWAAPVQVVTKRNGRFRLCVDFTRLNAVTVRDAFPVPLIDEMLRTFRGHDFLAAFDCTSGYHQAPVAPECRDMLSFCTTFGLFRFVRLPFGVTNGPAYFQRQVLSHVIAETDGTAAYVDDISLRARTPDEFIARLRRFLAHCRHIHLRLNADKSEILPRLLAHLGYLVDGDGYRIDPTRIADLAHLSIPTTKDALQSYLGYVNYFHRFVPSLATIAAPLRTLTHRDARFEWNDVHTAIFHRINDLIIHAPVLAHVHPDAQLILRCDASTVGLGGGLYQRLPDNDLEQPILFYSRRLTTAEAKYPVCELEMLAILVGLNKALPMLHGPVLVLTDHSNLQFLAHSVNRRVQRWAVLLNEFGVTVKHVPGATNQPADALSRLPPSPSTTTTSSSSISSALPSPPPLDASAIRAISDNLDGAAHSTNAAAAATPATADIAATDNDDDNDNMPAVPAPELATMLTAAGFPPPDSGRWVLNTAPSGNVVQRVFALAHMHVLAGHMGVARTLARIRPIITWPAMANDISRLVQCCPTCQRERARRHQPYAQLSTATTAPNQVVNADYIGPLSPSTKGKRYILTFIDRFTRTVALAACETADAASTMRALWKHWVTRYGVPECLSSDGGSHFNNAVLRSACELLEIQQHITVPYHPQSNGCVERSNAVVMHTLRNLLRDCHTLDWASVLPNVEFSINTAVNRVTGMSPFEALHGYAPRLPLHAALDIAAVDVDPDAPLTLTRHLLVLHQRIRDADQAAYDKVLRQLDAQARRAAHRYEVGEYVLVHFTPPPGKLVSPWQGPFLILEQDPNSELVYTVAHIDPTAAGQKTTFAVHVDRLHPFYPGNMTDEQLRATATGATNEYEVEEVLAHHYTADGRLLFYVKWRGFELTDPSDESEFCDYAMNSHLDIIKDYMTSHALSPPQLIIAAEDKEKKGVGSATKKKSTRRHRK